MRIKYGEARLQSTNCLIQHFQGFINLFYKTIEFESFVFYPVKTVIYLD